MASYLLTWNPALWTEWKPGDLIPMNEIRWSCVYRVNPIRRDDHVFLIRLGKDPKGIICHGRVTQGAYKDKHWKDASRECWYIGFKVKNFWDPEDPAIPMHLLKNDPRFSGENWSPQASGAKKITDDIAEALLHLEEWKHEGLASPDEISLGQKCMEGTRKGVYVNAYERSRHARRDCIAHHGAKCAVCGLVFAEKYGPEVKGLIHVHHLIPLPKIGKEYQVDPRNDLRPVCPNCHAVIHYKQGNSPREISEVKKMMRRK